VGKDIVEGNAAGRRGERREWRVGESPKPETTPDDVPAWAPPLPPQIRHTHLIDAATFTVHSSATYSPTRVRAVSRDSASSTTSSAGALLAPRSDGPAPGPAAAAAAATDDDDAAEEDPPSSAEDVRKLPMAARARARAPSALCCRSRAVLRTLPSSHDRTLPSFRR
jgi:hypothetical protein